jgi:hypothetical protein
MNSRWLMSQSYIGRSVWSYSSPLPSFTFFLVAWMFAVLPGVGFAEAPKGIDRNSEAETNAAVATPIDKRFLYDQIDLELQVTPDSEPVTISTRPAQMLYLNLPFGKTDNEVVSYAFLLQPEADGRPAASYDELGSVDDDLRFSLVVFCLEELPRDLERAPPPVSDEGIRPHCKPRKSISDAGDDVISLNFEGNIATGKHHLESFSGVTFRIKKYRRKTFAGDGRLGALAKCCLEAGGAEICACRVKYSNSTCDSGCV